MTLALYLDDDTGIPELVAQAAARGIRVLRSDDAGMRGRSDAEHLAYAAANDLLLVTCNRRDFLALHWEYMRAGQNHAGILVVHQSLPRGERIRLLLLFAELAREGEVRNRFEFLTDWQ